MTGLNYPDNMYADHEERKARRSQQPTGAYRSTAPVDPVTKPAHYQRAGIETIDYIRATLGDGFEAYCIGNVLKYVSRYREKGGIEDLRKAQVYLGWAIEPVKAGPKNPAALREAKIASDVACDKPSVCVNGCPPFTVCDYCQGKGGLGRQSERAPKWSLDWINTPPNCDGLSARDVRAPHPMAAEEIRDHDERLSGGEDRL